MPQSTHQAEPNIPGYCIINRLGKGGVAMVYRAKDSQCHRDVALKIISDDDTANQETIKRFQREALTASNLHHKNIIPIFTHGQSGPHHYIAMELMHGGSLRSKLAKGLEINAGVKIISELAEALDFLDQRGLVHRDIKPDNILFRGHDDTPLISDFGIAHIPGSDLTRLTKTEHSQYVGTPHYMSPERFQGKQPDIRSELYSLGIILYEILAGTLPFHCEVYDYDVIAHMQKTQSPPPLPSKAKAFKAVIKKALAKNPDKRYRSGAEFAQALNAITQDFTGITNKCMELVAGSAKHYYCNSILTQVDVRPVPPKSAHKTLFATVMMAILVAVIFYFKGSEFIQLLLRDGYEHSQALVPNTESVNQSNQMANHDTRPAASKTASSHEARPSPAALPIVVPPAEISPTPITQTNPTQKLKVTPSSAKPELTTPEKTQLTETQQAVAHLEERLKKLEHGKQGLEPLLEQHFALTKITALMPNHHNAHSKLATVHSHVEALIQADINALQFNAATQSVATLDKNNVTFIFPQIAANLSALEEEITAKIHSTEEQLQNKKFKKRSTNLNGVMNTLTEVDAQYGSPNLPIRSAAYNQLKQSYITEIEYLIDRSKPEKAAPFIAGLKQLANHHPQLVPPEVIAQLEANLRQAAEVHVFIDAF